MDMCNSTSTSGPSGASKWVLGAGKDAYSRVNAFTKKPYTPYNPVSRVAPLSAMQNQGLGTLSNYASSGQPNVFGDVRGRFQAYGDAPTDSDFISGSHAYGDAPASSVGTERLVDEGGRLGKMSDYINPNVAATLDPTMRAIQEQDATRRQRQAGASASAGAFGDARHGILERGIGQDTNREISDATSRAYSEAWNNAMGARSGDLGRFMQADSENAALKEAALGRGYQAATGLQTANEARLGRGFQAAQGISGAADAEQARKLGLIQSLLAGGGIQQQTQQNLRDARYAEFQRKSQDPYDKFNLLLSSFGKPNTTQQSTSTPDNPLMKIFGALAGGAF
jgi:hypothetical protein